MTPREYMERVVSPLYDDLQRDQSVHRLYAAVITAYHTVDYIASFRNKSQEAVREQAMTDCQDFRIIYSVALAQKHVIVNNNSAFRGMASSDIRDPRPITLTARGQPLTARGEALTAGYTGFGIELNGGIVDLGKPLRSVIDYFHRIIV